MAAESTDGTSSLAPGLRIAKNTLALILLRIVVPFLSMAVVLAVSRLLGTEGLGRYTLAFTFLYFFSTITPLGLYALITRDGAQDPSRLEGLLANSLTITTLASLPLTVGMALCGPLSGYDGPTQTAIALLSLALWPTTIGSMFEGAFVALERMDYLAYATMAENVVKVGIGVVLLACGFGLNSILALTVVGRLLACAISVLLLRRAGIRVRIGTEAPVLREVAKSAPTFLLIAIFATLYWRIDVFMLSQMRSVDDVGRYGAAWRLLEIALVLPQSFCLALYPRLASAVRSDRELLQELGRTAARYLAAASLPIVVCTWIVSGPILTLLYGESFSGTGDTLAVLMFTLIPYGWVRYHAYVLVAANRQRVDLILNVVMTILNVVLNLVLIPAYGPLGAAISTLASVIIYGIAQYAYLAIALPGYSAPPSLELIPLIATGLAGALTWTLRNQSALLSVGLAPLIYLAALALAGFFSMTELKVLRLDRVLGGFASSRGRAG